jgi:SAM-dependent methyltransferase
MSGATIAEFIGYWEVEGEAYVRRGDYEWMASLVPGQRVLEIGCGVGFATQALAARGLSVLALDSLPECLAATQARVESKEVTFLQAEISALTDEQRAKLESFAPNTVVCWLMGAPAEITGATATMVASRLRPTAKKFIAQWLSWPPPCRRCKPCILLTARQFIGRPRISAAIRWFAITPTKRCLICRGPQSAAMRCIASSTTTQSRWRESAIRIRH